MDKRYVIIDTHEGKKHYWSDSREWPSSPWVRDFKSAKQYTEEHKRAIELKEPSAEWKEVKTFHIPASWREFGIYEIEAISLEDAAQKAIDDPLPKSSDYEDGSFEIDWDFIRDQNPNLTDEEILKARKLLGVD